HRKQVRRRHRPSRRTDIAVNRRIGASPRRKTETGVKENCGEIAQQYKIKCFQSRLFLVVLWITAMKYTPTIPAPTTDSVNPTSTAPIEIKSNAAVKLNAVVATEAASKFRIPSPSSAQVISKT